MAKPMKSIQEITAFVEKKGGKLLSKTCVNSQSKIKIECNVCGNTWKASWNSIQQGYFCPSKCAQIKRINKYQDTCRKKRHLNLRIQKLMNLTTCSRIRLAKHPKLKWKI